MIEEEYDAFNFAFSAWGPNSHHYYNRPLQSLLIRAKVRRPGCEVDSAVSGSADSVIILLIL